MVGFVYSIVFVDFLFLAFDPKANNMRMVGLRMIFGGDEG